MNSSSLIHINLLDCHSAVYFRTLITVLFLMIDQNISMAKTNINDENKIVFYLFTTWNQFTLSY